MRLGVVITVYHSYERVVAFVRQLARLGEECVAVVVDNGASPESSAKLSEAIGAVLVQPEKDYSNSSGSLFLISSLENLGYAKGNNLGASFLQEHFGVEYLLFSNDDVTIETQGMPGQLIAVMNAHPGVKAIGPRVIGVDGADQSPHRRKISIYRQLGWRLLPFLRRRRRVAAQSGTAGALPPASGICYWVSGAFFLIESKAFSSCGGFDERTFLYYEEAILAERLLQKGWRMYFENTFVVHHAEGASTGKGAEMEAIRKESACIYYRYYCKNNPVLLWLFRLLA